MRFTTITATFLTVIASSSALPTEDTVTSSVPRGIIVDGRIEVRQDWDIQVCNGAGSIIRDGERCLECLEPTPCGVGPCEGQQYQVVDCPAKRAVKPRKVESRQIDTVMCTQDEQRDNNGQCEKCVSAGCWIGPGCVSIGGTWVPC